MFYGLLLSLHLGFQNSYNSIHPYIGMYLTDYLVVGAYYNSEHRVSAYAAYSFEIIDATTVEFGLVSGYSTATVQPMLKLTHKNIFISPATEKINGKITPGLVVGFEWRH